MLQWDPSASGWKELVKRLNGYLNTGPNRVFGALGMIYESKKSAGLAGVSSEMGLDEGLLVCTLLLLI